MRHLQGSADHRGELQGIGRKEGGEESDPKATGWMLMTQSEITTAREKQAGQKILCTSHFSPLPNRNGKIKGEVR